MWSFLSSEYCKQAPTQVNNGDTREETPSTSPCAGKSNYYFSYQYSNSILVFLREQKLFFFLFIPNASLALTPKTHSLVQSLWLLLSHVRCKWESELSSLMEGVSPRRECKERKYEKVNQGTLNGKAYEQHRF